MPDSDLNVKFTGDTSGLNASLVQARQALTAFAPAATGQASSGLNGLSAALAASKVASDVANSSWRENLFTLAALESVTRTAREAYESYAASVFKAEFAAASFVVQQEKTFALWYAQASLKGLDWSTEALGIQAAARALADYIDPAAYAERNTRLFAQANDGAVAAMKRTILAVGDYAARLKLAYSATPATELAGISAAGGLERFIAQVDAIGGAGSAKSTLVDFTAELQKIPGLSQEAAASIEVMLATIPNYTRASNDILVNLLQTISRTGDEAQANAKKITDAFRDDQNGGKILGDLSGQLKNLNDIQVLAARITATLSPAQAISYFDTVIAKLQQQVALSRAKTQEDQAALRATPLIGDMLAQVNERLTGADEAQRQFAAGVQIATLDLQRQRAAMEGIVSALKQGADYEKLIAEDSTRVGRLDRAQQNVDLLNSGATQGRSNASATVGDDRDLLIRTIIGEAGGQGAEGMAAVASVIRNRVESAFDGMKSYRDVILEGDGKQFNTWAPGNAAGDRARSMSADDPAYRAVAALVDKMTAGNLDDPTGGATSFYNPKTATNRFPMTNTTTIGDHVFGNTTGSPKVRDDDEDDERLQRLQEQNDAIRKINDEKRGGTEADLASLAIAQRNAAAAKDEVADAQALLDAKKKDLAATQGGSPSAVLAAQRAVAEAEQSLRDKSAAADKAAADLKVASAKEGSRERLDATIAELDAEQAAYAAGSARYLEIEKQKVEARQTFAKQAAAEAAEVENVRYDAQQRGYKEEQDQVKENARLKGETAEQELAATLASQERQLAAERAHYEALQRIYVDQPQQYRKMTQQLEELDARSHQLRQAAERNYQQEVGAMYRQTFEQIGSNISSSIMGMIQGTTTFKQAAINVARDMLQTFIQSRIRMVADWLAGEATKVQATVAGETAKTTAVQTGEAARTGLISLGSAVQAAQVGAGVVKSILSSAAETFAGIFGFLSPIMGPAAVGPAVAGQAAVAAAASAVPSFAIGAWSLPSDMVAQVHAGEMIVPAGPASLMRAAAGGGGAAAGAGGDVHHHTHFNVTAMDSRDVRRFFGDNAKHIIGAINDGVRSGSHLGLSRLRNV